MPAGDSRHDPRRAPVRHSRRSALGAAGASGLLHSALGRIVDGLAVACSHGSPAAPAARHGQKPRIQAISGGIAVSAQVQADGAHMSAGGSSLDGVPLAVIPEETPMPGSTDIPHSGEITLADTEDALRVALGGTATGGVEQAKHACALRLRCRLQPAGGPGAKVMPPTYPPDAKGGPPRYVWETRRISAGDDGALEPRVSECVLLDSLQSQAKRYAAALADRVTDGEIPLPLIAVDQQEFGVHTCLEFSHGCFDSYITDATYGGRAFAKTPEFAQIAGLGASRRNLTALMEVSPASLLLGCWNAASKEVKRTTRLARIITSEIIGVDATKGARLAGKSDIHHVSSHVTIYEHDGLRFTCQEMDGAKKHAKFGAKDKNKDQGKPSAAGYGDIAAQTAPGGVSMGHALQIATVSLPALRECRFPLPDGERDAGRDVAGRMMLVSLALRMLTLQAQAGYDLRSGCLLIPDGPPAIELVGRYGKVVGSWRLDQIDTAQILARQIEEGASQGIGWEGQRLSLSAADNQLELLRKSAAADEKAGDAA